MTEREVFKKYDNLSRNEMKSKNNKEVYVRNDVITNVIVHGRGEKQRAKKKKKMNSEENYGLENLILWYLGNTLGKNF